MKRALVLSLAVVLGLGLAAFGQSLTGEWTLGVVINPLLSDFAAAIDFSSSLTVNYEVGGWTFTSLSVFGDAGWTDQKFYAEGSLGAYTFGSMVDFAPTGAFQKLTVDAGVAIGGMTFAAGFTLEPGTVELVLTGSGSTSLVDIDIELTFGDALILAEGDGCDLDWAGVVIDATFPFCCADVTASIEFNCLGFVEACFGVQNVVIPNLPWVTVGAEVCFQTLSKTLTLTPAFDFGVDVCFDLFITQNTQTTSGVLHPGLGLGNIDFDGIAIECEIGGVAFSGISYWGPAKFWNAATYDYTDYPGLLAGHNLQYWEAYQIATTDTACCGPFTFDITVYFDDTATGLFDVGLFVANMSLEVASELTFGMGVEYDVVLGAQEWSIDFTVTW